MRVITIKERCKVTVQQEFRMTHQRRIILDELQKCRVHPTADELYMKVREIMPRISLGTVYRNLEVLSDMGSILKLDFVGNQRRFDGNSEFHYHIVCTECGRIDDVGLDEVMVPTIPDAGFHGFSNVACTLFFTGLCPDCASSKQ